MRDQRAASVVYSPREQPAFDRYTLGHLTAGLAYGAAGLSFWQAFAAQASFEAFETAIKADYPSIFPIPKADRPANVAGDILAALVGWQVWRSLMGEKRTGGGWTLVGAAVWAASAWSLRWPEARP